MQTNSSNFENVKSKHKIVIKAKSMIYLRIGAILGSKSEFPNYDIFHRNRVFSKQLSK